jgi:CheY-like chemotaxis protein
MTILETQDDFQLVGEAANGREALSKINEIQPDLIMLDLEMPELDGVEVIQQLRARGSEVGIIVFTVFDTDDRILAAIRAGAQGYLKVQEGKKSSRLSVSWRRAVPCFSLCSPRVFFSKPRRASARFLPESWKFSTSLPKANPIRKSLKSYLSVKEL